MRVSATNGEQSMEYIMFINDVESEQMGPEDPSFGQFMGEYEAFAQMLEREGIDRGSNRLMPTATATTIRVRDGKTLTSDGPFAETKEQIGGYWIVECRDLDHAIEIAAQIPSAKLGSIEVRPVMSMG